MVGSGSTSHATWCFNWTGSRTGVYGRWMNHVVRIGYNALYPPQKCTDCPYRASGVWIWGNKHRSLFLPSYLSTQALLQKSHSLVKIPGVVVRERLQKQPTLEVQNRGSILSAALDHKILRHAVLFLGTGIYFPRDGRWAVDRMALEMSEGQCGGLQAACKID